MMAFSTTYTTDIPWVGLPPPTTSRRIAAPQSTSMVPYGSIEMTLTEIRAAKRKVAEIEGGRGSRGRGRGKGSGKGTD